MEAVVTGSRESEKSICMIVGNACSHVKLVCAAQASMLIIIRFKPQYSLVLPELHSAIGK